MMECEAESTCMFSGVGMKPSMSDLDSKAFPDYFWSGLDYQEEMNGFSSCGGNGETLLVPQNFTSNHSSIAVTMDSYSSICEANLSYGSPVSANKPKSSDINEAKGAISVSSHEQSDVDEQSTEPMDLKRQRRKRSNRDSARRSRRRKQEQLADLESQVEQLKVEKASLDNQYSDVTQSHHNASTINQLLKYKVEELRAKVKLAEDMVARGSISCSLKQLLQIHLSAPQPINSYNLHRMANVLPTINVCQDDSSYAGMTVSGNSTLGLGSVDLGNGSLNTGISSDAVSCVSDIWY